MSARFSIIQAWILICLFLAGAKGVQAASSSETAKLGAFVDTYYAFSSNQPRSFDRAYTTQPARHNEFNINLAFIEGQLSLDRVRGRLAFQAGTSVQSNYAGEPSRGFISGPFLSRHLQEAYAGYEVAKDLWIDAGIYFSHLGLESFISRDNWTYSRSLVSDYSPYYQSGAKLSYQLNSTVGAQLHILNGWQNISESSHEKAIGTQIALTPARLFSFSYNTLVTHEPTLRLFNDFVFKIHPNDFWQAAAVFDLGMQKVGGSFKSWYGSTLVNRFSFTRSFATAVRVERFWDKSEIIASTFSSNGFQIWGASINFDAQLHTRLLWRTEFRGFLSRDPIYPKMAGSLTKFESFAATSLALTI